jgi:hypothetical protein
MTLHPVAYRCAGCGTQTWEPRVCASCAPLPARWVPYETQGWDTLEPQDADARSPE